MSGRKGGSTLGRNWTVREVLNWTRGYFRDGGIVQPRLEAEILLAHALDVDRLHLYLSPDKPLDAAELKRYRELIKQRKAGNPLQYLIGEVSFFGLRFRVNRHALIPRAETEELLERALQLAPRGQPLDCLDLGTGTGVIAVCLAKFLPQASVIAVDISTQALQLARDNAELNGVADRIIFRQSDWFDSVDGKFDLIISNPPYIERENLSKLATEVREHEPRAAVDGGPGGTEQLERLINGLQGHTRPGTIIMLEVGDGQGERMFQSMECAGVEEVKVENDLADKERFVIARCP